MGASVGIGVCASSAGDGVDGSSTRESRGTSEPQAANINNSANSRKGRSGL
jgi:hypothetical protein